MPLQEEQASLQTARRFRLGDGSQKRGEERVALREKRKKTKNRPRATGRVGGKKMLGDHIKNWKVFPFGGRKASKQNKDWRPSSQEKLTAADTLGGAE